MLLLLCFAFIWNLFYKSYVNTHKIISFLLGLVPSHKKVGFDDWTHKITGSYRQTFWVTFGVCQTFAHFSSGQYNMQIRKRQANKIWWWWSSLNKFFKFESYLFVCIHSILRLYSQSIWYNFLEPRFISIRHTHWNCAFRLLLKLIIKCGYIFLIECGA